MSSVPSLIPFYSSVIGILAFFFMQSNSTISDTLANTQKVFAIFMIIYAFEFYIFGPFFPPLPLYFIKVIIHNDILNLCKSTNNLGAVQNRTND